MRRILFLGCIGGGSVLFWCLARIAEVQGHAFGRQIDSFALESGTLLALLVYQPHFVATYQLNYSRGMDHLRRHPWTFFGLPILLLAGVPAIRFFPASGSVLSAEIPVILLLLVLAAGLHHFAAQAAAVTVREAGLAVDSTFSTALRWLLVATAVHGFARFAGIHGGVYSLFGVEARGLALPSSVIAWSGALLVALHLAFAAAAYRRHWKWHSSLPWAAFALWYLSDVFVEKYFFLIPGLHALQFAPYYRERTRTRGLPWGRLGVVFASLLLVFALPNWLAGPGVDPGTTDLPLFALILFAINLHHFAMERITWRGHRRNSL